MSDISPSDKQIVSTGKNVQSLGDEFRFPEIRVVGREPHYADNLTDDEVVGEQGFQPTSQGTDVGVPRDIIVESQKVRIQPDGSAVIDIEVSFEEALGADSHQVRVTKV